MLLLVSYEINLIRDAALNTQFYFNVNNIILLILNYQFNFSLIKVLLSSLHLPSTMKKRNIISLFAIVTSTLMVTYLFSSKPEQNSSPIRNPLKIIRQKKQQILIWDALPGRMSDILGGGSDGFFRLGCEFTNCYVTGDRNKRPISTYDAVVFNMNVLHSSGIAPWTVTNFTRSENQRFVFFSLEPPMYITIIISYIVT